VVGKPLGQIVGFSPFAADIGSLALGLVEHTNHRDKMGLLVTTARDARPDSRELLAAAEQLGLSSTGRVIPKDSLTIDGANNLEKLVRKVTQKVPIATFLSRVALAEVRVCRVQIDRNAQEPIALGTGFLVAGDRVMTNYHVIEPILKGTYAPQSLRFVFDYRTDISGTVVTSGRAVSAGDPWCIASQPYAPGDIKFGDREAKADELDFALLKVAHAVGDEKIIETGITGAQVRGFFDLTTVAVPPPANEPMFVLGHPTGEPLAISMGSVLSHAAEGRRLRHDAYTLGGSSGSPVFNADFQLVGLHHAGDPRDGAAQFNQAIPIGLIAQAAP
jgi:S1-C subfamily serine protease